MHTLHLTKNNSFIVGVSGGADSVVLLYALRQLGMKCLAVHCNFRLRGAESDRDEQFVRDFCKDIGVDLFVEQFHTEQYAADNKISVEMAARDLRYTLFEKLRRENNYDYIAVAHHRDDQIETVILNMLRGCGMRGVAGMKLKNGFIIRPLLTVSRKSIEHFADEHQLMFITDSTNLESVYKRNKIRLDLLPLLEQIHPGATDTLERTILNLSAAEHYYRLGVDEAVRRIVKREHPDSETFSIDIELLMKEESPGTLLFEVLNPLGFNRSVLESILQSLNSISGTQFLSQTHRIVKDRNQLLILPLIKHSENEYFISIDQRELTEPLKLKIEILPKRDMAFQKNKSIAIFDYEKLKFPLVLRHWRQGDKMNPLGMKGSKKISDIFINLKYTLPQKEEAWLLCSDDEIIWLTGERISDRFKVTETTTTIYKMYLE
ncbi:MAG: tRNA lysidine(34) synthetase TilS [Bacteroidales bacterium]